MSAAAAEAAPPITPPAKGKKKLIIIIAAVLLLVAVGGGGTVFWMKKKAAAAAAAAAEEDGDGTEEVEKKHDSHAAAPTFVPLDPFTVNLADRESERYAQIGMTLEVDDAKFAEQLKAYMPAIRNNILMVLAHKTSTELLQREGKLALAAEVARVAVQPMGIEVEDDSAQAAGHGDAPTKADAPEVVAKAESFEKTDKTDNKAEKGDKAEPAEAVEAPKVKKKKKKAAVHNPVRQVHFSNFIIQ